MPSPYQGKVAGRDRRGDCGASYLSTDTNNWGRWCTEPAGHAGPHRSENPGRIVTLVWED